MEGGTAMGYLPLTERVPAHVLPELVWDRSFSAFMQELDDPWLAGSRLHEGPDIVWATEAAYGQPGWIVTRHAPMQEVLVDHRNFTSEAPQMAPLLGVDWELNPINFDPPAHFKYRQVLNPFFTPRAVRQMDAAIRAICSELLDPLVPRGGCEFIGDFALKFPSYVFLALMGMPREMLPQFLEWEDGFMRAPDPELRLAAARGILGYLELFVEEQRIAPSTELMRGILDAEIDGRPLSQGEIMGMLYLLYLGGLDTVYSSLGWHMRHLARDPALQVRLRSNPQDIPRAVDELTRAFAVSKTLRTVARDIEFHGVPMRAGDPIHTPTYLAARDPRVFERPHEVDIDRRTRAISFGYGAHICLGVHLAKRELRIVLEMILGRCNDVRLVEGEPIPFHTGSVLGIDRLVLEWGTGSD
jgi:cytochrome P450